MKTPQYIFVHHTAVSYTKNPDQWQATDKYHKSKGWGGGGYNAEISMLGSVHTFRKDGAVTASQYQQNMNDGRALSICLDGNFDTEVPTLEQCNALYKWIKEKMDKYNIPRSNVLPHRAIASKSCWGRLLPDDIMSYLEARLGESIIPEWAKESVEKAKAKGITHWGNPWQVVDPVLLEQVLNKLGYRDKLQGTITKVELIHALNKAGIL